MENEEFKLLKKDAPTNILTLLGDMNITRDYYFSRSKSEGFEEMDKVLEISNKHLMTKGMMETITYASQKDDSFKEGSESLKKYLDLDISIKQMQLITGDVGECIFEKDMEEATKVFSEEFEKDEDARNKWVDEIIELLFSNNTSGMIAKIEEIESKNERPSIFFF